MKNKRLLSLLASVLFLCATFQLSAQRAAGDVGIGIQFGQPSGLSLQIYQPRGMSPDFLAAWDLNDFFFLNVHGVFNNHIGNSEKLHFFYGPGGFIGIIDREGQDDIDLGVSGTIGLSLMIKKLELYIRATPRLALLDGTEADVGGGFGVRFFL